MPKNCVSPWSDKSAFKRCKDENNYHPKSWDHEIIHDNDIFYSSNLLFTNFLKWCCTASDEDYSRIYKESEDNDTDD